MSLRDVAILKVQTRLGLDDVCKMGCSIATGSFAEDDGVRAVFNESIGILSKIGTG